MLQKKGARASVEKVNRPSVVDVYALPPANSESVTRQEQYLGKSPCGQVILALKKIMRVLGISLWPEKLSDEQYIERIRKAVQTRKRWRYVQGAIAVGLLVMAIWLLFIAIQILGDFSSVGKFTKNPHPTVEQQLVYSTFALAILLGFWFGFLFYKALFFIAETLFGFRQQKLLVECWDALSDAEKNRLRQQSS